MQHAAKQLFQDEDAFASVLLAVFLKIFGDDAIQWSPKTIQLELRDELGVTFSAENLAKLLVAINIVTTDDFHTRLPRFIFSCNVLSGTLPDEFDPADPAECAWGLTEAWLLWPPETEEEKTNWLSAEIQYYIGAMLDEHGITDAQDQLLKYGKRIDTGVQYRGLDATDPDQFAAEYDAVRESGQDIADMVHINMAELQKQLQPFLSSHAATTRD